MKEYYPDDYRAREELRRRRALVPLRLVRGRGRRQRAVGGVAGPPHALRQPFFQQEFGVASQEFMLPDCFGFPSALPTILAHCGIKGFSTQKLTWGSAVGIPFKVGNWKGPDGKSVVAALDPGAYTGERQRRPEPEHKLAARASRTPASSPALRGLPLLRHGRPGRRARAEIGAAGWRRACVGTGRCA